MPIWDWHVGLSLWSTGKENSEEENPMESKLRNSPPMKFPLIFPWCTPISKITITIITMHLVQGKKPFHVFSCPVFPKETCWKLISLFPSPAQETPTYFLLCVGNGKGEPDGMGWGPAKHCQTTAGAKSRPLCHHLKPQIPDWGWSEMFWCSWAFLLHTFPFLFLLMGLVVSISVTHS